LRKSGKIAVFVGVVFLLPLLFYPISGEIADFLQQIAQSRNGIASVRCFNLAFILIFWLVFGLLGYRKAGKKGLSRRYWTLLCALTGPWGYIHLTREHGRGQGVLKGMSMPASNPDFADRLITLLTEAGLRPSDLASRADIPLEVVEACLKGELPDALSLYRIAKALDVTMEWLLAGGISLHEDFFKMVYLTESTNFDLSSLSISLGFLTTNFLKNQNRLRMDLNRKLSNVALLIISKTSLSNSF